MCSTGPIEEPAGVVSPRGAEDVTGDAPARERALLTVARRDQRPGRAGLKLDLKRVCSPVRDIAATSYDARPEREDTGKEGLMVRLVISRPIRSRRKAPAEIPHGGLTRRRSIRWTG